MMNGVKRLQWRTLGYYYSRLGRLRPVQSPVSSNLHLHLNKVFLLGRKQTIGPTMVVLDSATSCTLRHLASSSAYLASLSPNLARAPISRLRSLSHSAELDVPPSGTWWCPRCSAPNLPGLTTRVRLSSKRTRKVGKRNPGENEVVSDCKLCGYKTRLDGSDKEARERCTTLQPVVSKLNETSNASPAAAAASSVEKHGARPSSLPTQSAAATLPTQDGHEPSRKKRRPNKREGLQGMLERSKAEREAATSTGSSSMLSSFLQSL
jgi:RNase P subunit RPR2